MARELMSGEPIAGGYVSAATAIIPYTPEKKKIAHFFISWLHSVCSHYL
jgi:hypothetical protein